LEPVVEEEEAGRHGRFRGRDLEGLIYRQRGREEGLRGRSVNLEDSDGKGAPIRHGFVDW
jgi:hypothetical protein